MLKTRQIIIRPITCSKGHTFYPKVMPSGEIKKYDRCIERDCRVYLDTNRVLNGKKKRQENLKLHVKNPITYTKNRVADKITSSTVQRIERPRCSICNLTFYDEQNLTTHNKRLHPQL